MTPEDEIAATQLRNRLEALGVDFEQAIRDAYARGLADGLARARAEFPPLIDLGPCRIVDDVADRRPTVV